MAILAVDEVMLREPRLLVPGMQPTGLVKVDRESSLARGLIYKKVFNNTHNLTLGNEGGLRGHENGLRLYCDGSNDFATSARPSFLGKLSFACGYIIHAYPGSGDAMLVGAGTSNSSSHNCALWFGCTNKMTFGRTWDGNGTWMWEGNATPVGKYTQVVWVWDSDSAGSTSVQSCYKNGKNDGVTTNFNGAAGVITQNGLTLHFCSDYYGTTRYRYLNASLFYFFVWNRALTPAEGISLSADPYQFLIPA